MLAVAKEWPGPGLSYETEMPAPVPAVGEVLLRPRLVGICGTDLHIEAWEEPYRDLEVYLPTVLGHEVLAEVVEGENFCAGERVVALSVYGCGRCGLCRSGQTQLCPEARRESLGMARNGGLAELMTLPGDRLLAVPRAVPDKVAALCEPFATAVRAVRGVVDGRPSRVAVLGPGAIGLMVASVAALWKPERLVVAGTESDCDRLELAEELGLQTVIAGAEGARTLTDALGGPADVVFETAGSVRAVEDGLEALGPGGELVVVGMHGEPLPVPPGRFVRRELCLSGSYAAGNQDWKEALRLLRHGEVDLQPLAGPVFGLDEARAAFRATEAGVTGRALVRCTA